MRLLLWIFLPFVCFAQAEIELGGHILKVEISDTVDSQSRGLQGRKHLGESEGMLFVYQKPQLQSFWMKDTLIPLSIGYFDKNRVLFQVIDMDPPSGKSIPSYRSRSPALYALEVNQGWFREHGVDIGAQFSFVE